MYHKLHHLTFDYVVIVFTVSSVKPHPVDNCVKMKKSWFQQSIFVSLISEKGLLKLKLKGQNKVEMKNYD